MDTVSLDHEQPASAGYAVEYGSGKTELRGAWPPAFTLAVADERSLERILKEDAYSAALGFIRGDYSISGDLVAAMRLKQRYSGRTFLHALWTLAVKFAPGRLETWFQSRSRAARNIRFHYDISNDFYGAFLDSRRVYSAGCFDNPSWSLEQAQEARLEGICRDLDLRPGERFLDVGCGWGGLLMHAAERHGVCATGCTLSHRQWEFADSAIGARRLRSHAAAWEVDYRDISGEFDKISSIGMFEHVGRRRLGNYFRKIHSLLKPGGRFLNSGITRPQPVHDDPQTWFLLKRVFPGGELAHLSDVVREAEGAGFGVVEIRSHRLDYARTCREWVERLRQNGDVCRNLVGDETYRTWLLYLSASALSFETGQTGVFSLLMTKGATAG